MKKWAYTGSNSWLAFADDLLWPRRPSLLHKRLFRNMLVQQFLFVETCLIVDSWWLTNEVLRYQLDETDLSRSLDAGWIVPAINTIWWEKGLKARWDAQATLPKANRLHGLLTGDRASRFFEKVDTNASFSSYDVDTLGSFFEEIFKVQVQSDSTLKRFELLGYRGKLQQLLEEKSAMKQRLTRADLFRLFERNDALRHRVMEMVAPIYVLGAPLSYKYNITFAARDTRNIFTSLQTLITDLTNSHGDPLVSTGDTSSSILINIDVGDAILQNAGMLTFDEIAGARTTHFEKFRAATIKHVSKEIGASEFELAYKNYQSDVIDYLVRENNNFDALAVRILKGTHRLVRFSKAAVPEAAQYYTFYKTKSGEQAVFMKVAVSTIMDEIQYRLDAMTNIFESRTQVNGSMKLMTRLDAWITPEMKDRYPGIDLNQG